MIRRNEVERAVIQALGATVGSSTGEVARIVNRMGVSVGRPAIRRALHVLETDGTVENVGGVVDTWRLA